MWERNKGHPSLKELLFKKPKTFKQLEYYLLFTKCQKVQTLKTYPKVFDVCSSFQQVRKGNKNTDEENFTYSEVGHVQDVFKYVVKRKIKTKHLWLNYFLTNTGWVSLFKLAKASSFVLNIRDCLFAFTACEIWTVFWHWKYYFKF